MTADEIKDFLTQKFTIEKKRLRSYGTKYSMYDLAHAVYRHIESLMTESRYRELKRFEKYGLHNKKEGWNPVIEYLNERKKATKNMARAIKHVAETNDSNRPWKRKVEKKDKKKKHGHSRSTRSSRS